MAINEHNDNELNDYLKGGSDVSKAYRASNDIEPASHLDKQILSAARDAVSNNSADHKPLFHKSPWALPVSVAAMITLSVSLVVTMQQEAGQPLISEPEVEMFDQAAIMEKPAMRERMSEDSSLTIGERQYKQEKDKFNDAAAPAALNAMVDGFRAEEKVEVLEKRKAEVVLKKTMPKEKSQMQTLEESKVVEEERVQQAVSAAEHDAMMKPDGIKDVSPDKIMTFDEGMIGWERMNLSCQRKIDSKEKAVACFKRQIWTGVEYSKINAEIKQGYIEIGGTETHSIATTTANLKVFIFRQHAIDISGAMYLFAQPG